MFDVKEEIFKFLREKGCKVGEIRGSGLTLVQGPDGRFWDMTTPMPLNTKPGEYEQRDLK